MVAVRALFTVVLVLASVAMVASAFDPFSPDSATPPSKDEIARTRRAALFWLLLGVAVLIFFMVVAWRAMKGIESIAESAARMAAGVDRPGEITPSAAPGEGAGGSVDPA